MRTPTTVGQRHDFRRFAGRLAALALLVVGSQLVIALWPVAPTGYLAAVADKQQRLQSLPSPKVVLVGGSNLSFGIDSEYLEERLDRPVVNMGLGIYAGLRFMLDSVLPHVQAGDIVVMSAEYQLFYGLFDGDEELFDILEAFPEGIRFIRSPHQAYMLARSALIFSKLKFHRLLAGLGAVPDHACIYCRSAFNEYGDLVSHLDAEPIDVGAMKLFRSGRRRTGIDPEAIDKIAEFAAAVRNRGATALILYPPVPEPHYERNREAIQAVHLTLTSRGVAPVLLEPQDARYPIEWFFDWVYHLHGHGRSERSRTVAELLRPYLDR